MPFSSRRDLSTIMPKRKYEIDVKLLRFAIEKTVAFETIVEKRFQGNTLDHANNPITGHLNGMSFLLNKFSCIAFGISVRAPNTNETDETNLSGNAKSKTSPFQGIISQCFEDHLDIYIAELDRYASSFSVFLHLLFFFVQKSR